VLRPLVRGDLGAVRDAWAASGGDPERADGWERELALGAAGMGVAEGDGALVAFALARTLGRTAHVLGLGVTESARGVGLGSQVLEGLVAALLRRDVAVVGLEVDAGLPAVSWLARRGFKPMHPTFALEAAAQAGVASAGVELLPAGAEARERMADLARLCASLDADLDAGPWCLAHLEDGSAEVATVMADGGVAPSGFAVLPRAVAGEPALEASLVVVDEGAPFPMLSRLEAGLRSLASARGLPRVRLHAPARAWDAFRHLLHLGYRPAGSVLRMTLQGFPERADTRRALLTSWK
jgi:GNAT superfamily N-acetyltransferase